jgi:hypothetical protein
MSRISPRTRFAILCRDRFACRYCGSSPPNAILQIDHVVPRSKGGSNLPSNLIASCEQCNLGKADLLLQPTEMPLSESFEELGRFVASLKHYGVPDERVEDVLVRGFGHRRTTQAIYDAFDWDFSASAREWGAS